MRQGGSDGEDVGKMPDQVGHDEDGCKGREFRPTLHLEKHKKKKNNKKREKIRQGRRETCRYYEREFGTWWKIKNGHYGHF